MLPKPRNERMAGVNNMNMDGPTLPQPPQPKRRGSLEFYEWVVLLLFLGSLGLGTATTFNLDPDNVGVKEDANVMAWALPFFFLIIIIWFDVSAAQRYARFSDELLTQWKEDKIQFMKMFTEDMRKKYDKNGDGKISSEELDSSSEE